MIREPLLREVALKFLAGQEQRSIIAVDGVDGSGKSTFADALAITIRRLGRPVIRASVDGFHNPREVRYRLGRHSPEGYFLDSYNYDALRRSTLFPFRSGAPTIQTAHFDHRTNREAPSAFVVIEPSSVLLIDGIFLHRDELVSSWDMSVFLDVPFAVTFKRMADRDGSKPDPIAPENRRYFQGQCIYLKKCKPRERATIVIDYADPEAPRIIPRSSLPLTS